MKLLCDFKIFSVTGRIFENPSINDRVTAKNARKIRKLTIAWSPRLKEERKKRELFPNFNPYFFQKIHDGEDFKTQ